MKKLVSSGEIPGILAYDGGKPVGWCSIAPREAYPSLERSRMLKRIDDKPVWSIICFYIAKEFQHEGLMAVLIKAAIAYAKKNHAAIVEAYPIIPERSKSPKWEAYTGIITTFRRLGFKKVLQRSKIRVIMRYYVRTSKGKGQSRQH
jgi:GNAT superfamily N-acetyltransferase